jgi:hypothetical protein
LTMYWAVDHFLSGTPSWMGTCVLTSAAVCPEDLSPSSYGGGGEPGREGVSEVFQG